MKINILEISKNKDFDLEIVLVNNLNQKEQKQKERMHYGKVIKQLGSNSKTANKNGPMTARMHRE